MIDIEGVREGPILSYGCPYLIDLTIDGRPAHYRARHGSARLTFEDGEQEIVYEAYNEGDIEGFQDMYERHMATMVPALRAKARGKAVENDERVKTVKEFLDFARIQDYRQAELAEDDFNYGEHTSRTLHEREVDEILAAWLESLY